MHGGGQRGVGVGKENVSLRRREHQSFQLLQDPKTLRDNDLQDATGILARSEEENDETSRKDQRRKIRHASVTTLRTMNATLNL
jgi:hypothetical protein